MSLDSFKDRIESKIDALIDKKLNERLLRKSVERPGAANKDVTARNVFSNEREGNIIIHGLTEAEENKFDENRVQEIFQAIDVKCKPMTMYRLGVKHNDRTHPLMVSLQS